MDNLGDTGDLEELWIWFGDREVFFCVEEDNIFTNSYKVMLECFEVLDYDNGCVVWKLKPNPESLGLVDVMGHLLDCHSDMDDDDELGVFCTHNAGGEETEVIEHWKIISRSWWDNHSDSSIRDALTNYKS